MSQSFRHPQILEIARREGKVAVEELVAHFGVTAQTIRRDLNDLAEAGQLERVHGGAILPSGTENIVYAERSRLNRAAKEAIGRACAAAVPQDSSLFLNIGTTTEAVARHLLSHRGLMVMTNNLNVANILIGNPEADIVVAGGSFRRSDSGLVGPLTQASVESYKFDLAVIGCSAIDADGDLLDFDAQEVGVTQTILRRARRVFLVADHSKFERTAPVRIGSLSQVDRLFTDRPLPPVLRDLDLEVVLAG
ncbi:DeoR/GlpR family DNA-binding transcription regulator [Poseidonocella sp. HB161398]|uniref:DeoR/GlpR family DNA-binding transcription regulator n=1 Tax=Poseidonocella sp. HB161398 TaxID=2320855 RepID=UPI0011092F34|nr:DeoR/GlpR family DNA-binding transcription regulator [Poseidonocella sp. HB161398]